jgi:uncharacterized membrane protein
LFGGGSVYGCGWRSGRTAGSCSLAWRGLVSALRGTGFSVVSSVRLLRFLGCYEVVVVGTAAGCGVDLLGTSTCVQAFLGRGLDARWE